MFSPGSRPRAGDELTPLPRPGRVGSHGDGSAGEGSGQEGDTEPAIPWHGEKEVPPRATPPHHFLSWFLYG